MLYKSLEKLLTSTFLLHSGQIPFSTFSSCSAYPIHFNFSRSNIFTTPPYSTDSDYYQFAMLIIYIFFYLTGDNLSLIKTVLKGILGMFVLFIVLGAVFGGSSGDTEDVSTEDDTEDVSVSDESSNTEDVSTEDVSVDDEAVSDEPEVVSTSFSDFTPYLDPDSTQLQKESFFDENFKGKYVTWSGTVSTVSESSNSYAVQVVHKSSTLISDVRVEFRADQKDKLLQLKEGDPITYTAKMTRYGEILGMSAEDGVVV